MAWAFTVLCGDMGPVRARTQQSPLGTWAGPRPQRQLRLLFSGRVQALLLWTSGKGSLYVSGFSCLSVLGGAVVWVDMGEGNGTPLQYSCVENPMDGGAW